MWNKSKRIISLVAAATFLTAAFSLTACGEGNYKGDKLDYTSAPTEDGVSNGGFVVEKGDYVYFINGAEEYTANNKTGEVTKGALMRISKTALEGKEYGEAEVVVPKLFVSQNYNAGFYIYGDYVYYATPTTDKNLEGEVENSWIDFKSAKLDGTYSKEYYFRLSNNSANYRFVKVGDVVYCLYEEDGALKSYNTQTKKTNVLVSGAKSSFYFDTKDLTNADVYYTMSVAYDKDSEHSTTAQYDQLYRVNAADVIEKIDSKNASYTVKGGKTYDFDENYLKEQNKKAKENKSDEPYDLGDYTTYPYVNLGELVLDGIGLIEKNTGKVTQFNELKDATPATPEGYTYTITSYQNGGVYFTRSEVVATESEGDNKKSPKLYYLADADSSAESWNAVEGNKNLDVVALNTKNASTSALYTIDENGAHNYFYFADGNLYKAGQPDAEGNVETMALAYNITGTLWMIDGDYLYYYGTGTNGNNISCINYTGSAVDYNPLRVTEEYEPLTLAYVDWNSSWYKPEIVNGTLIYCNAQSFGSTSYNYIYATKLGTTEDLKKNNEAYEKVNEFIDSYSKNSALQDLMKYYFRTEKQDAYEAVKDLYSDYQKEEFAKFVEECGKDTYKLENEFIAQLGATKESDVEAINEAWANSLLTREEVEEDKSLPGWAIALIIVGSVLVVGAAVAVPVLVMNNNKKKAAQAEADAIVNAHKKKIDTTDDKSIDVYAEEVEAAEEAPAEEVAEEVVEEVEAAEEAPAEEVAEEVAPVEEAPVVEEAPAEAAPVEEAPAEEPKTEE